LLATMQAAGGGVAIIPTAPERVRNRDTHHGYRFDSYFYYLTGFREPEAVLVLVAGDPAACCSAAARTSSARSGTATATAPRARETFGFDEAHPIAELDAKLASCSPTSPPSSTRWATSPTGTAASPTPSTVRAQARSGAWLRPRSATCAA
jgi:Xaa-Pro aminopeptidase